MEIKEYHSDMLTTVSEIYLNGRISTFSWLDTNGYCLTDFVVDTEGERVLVALVGGHVVGFISIWESENFVHHLYVSDEHQGKGIGICLLDKAIVLYGSLSLKCMVENEKAVGFYESYGFVRIETGVDSLGDYYLMGIGLQTSKRPRF